MKAKKIMTVGMAAALALALTVPVMADTSPVIVEQETGAASFGVYANVTKKINEPSFTDNYYVSVSWTATNGAYAAPGDSYRWDGNTKSYVRSAQRTSISGSPATVSITVANQSNKSMDYEISYANYAGTTQTETAETTTSGSKTGTLTAYTTANSISIAADSSAAASVSYSGEGYTTPSATYEASIDLTNYQPDSYQSGSAVKQGTYTVTFSRTYAVEITLDNNPSTVLTSTALLETAADAVTYYMNVLNSNTYTAYNGYISETRYATYDEAERFVYELNHADITPNGQEDCHGRWMLLDDDPTINILWAKASGATSYRFSASYLDDEFGGVYYLWTTRTDRAWYCIRASSVASPSDLSHCGFVVVWLSYD